MLVLLLFKKLMGNDSKPVGSPQNVTEGQEREVMIGRKQETVHACTSLSSENSQYLIQSQN